MVNGPPVAPQIALHLVEEPPPPMPFYIAEALESEDLDSHFEAAYSTSS